jgi:hypothetical protein
VIKSEDLIQNVRQLANDAPYNTYEGNKNGYGCCYAKGECSDGSIGCIIGQAMITCDESITEYISDPARQSKQFELLWDDMCETNLMEMSREEMNWCSKVQGLQDDGVAWQEAVSQADGVKP